MLTAFSTVLVVGLLAFNVQQSPPAAVAVATVSDVTFDGYFTRLAQVRDRPFEREEYTKKLMGSRVRWDGFVAEVRLGKEESDKHHLKLVATRNHGDGRAAVAVFPRTLRRKLAALRIGAQVRVSGTLDLSSVYFPFIERADSIETIAEMDDSAKQPR